MLGANLNPNLGLDVSPAGGIRTENAKFVRQIRMSPKSIPILMAAILAALAAGCGVEPETLETLRQAVNTVSTQTPLASQLDADLDAVDPRFHPPYPDRVDPFSFPADAPVADQAGTTLTTVAQVEVMGFAQIDEPRVFLRTKEMTKSLKVGDVTDGVEVIAIKPPAVELRMGSLVWTATMFDNTTMAQD
jgi:hypothetical protein